MPIEAGATYVFDLGYYDYAWWAELDAAGCRIVTRFKSNTPLTSWRSCRSPKAATSCPTASASCPRARPAAAATRSRTRCARVRVRIETGKVLRILSNDLDASAQEIADLYKRRWAIELFFRWVKQTLKITHFVGTTENAVRIQIAVALIAFLLLRLAQATQNDIKSPLAFARLVRTNLMHRRRIDQLLTTPPKRLPRSAPDQPPTMLKLNRTAVGHPRLSFT